MLVNDVGTGILAAFGTIVALYHHRRTGEGQEVNASLSQTATLHQASYLVLREGEEDIKAVGLDAAGWNPLQRLYRASDGWFFLAADEGQAENVWAAAELAGPFPADPAFMERQLSTQFASAPRDQWVGRLVSAGIGAHAVIVSSFEAASHPAYAARGAVRRVTSPAGESALHPLIPPWLSLTPPQVRRSSGPFGSDLPTVLAELGRAQELESLLADRTVARDGPLVVGVED
jgi:crotonobetainyl-CoA:carnitine CoA-transferase CaiB-like acyl-CoA transferase